MKSSLSTLLSTQENESENIEKNSLLSSYSPKNKNILINYNNSLKFFKPKIIMNTRNIHNRNPSYYPDVDSKIKKLHNIAILYSVKLLKDFYNNNGIRALILDGRKMRTTYELLFLREKLQKLDIVEFNEETFYQLKRKSKIINKKLKMLKKKKKIQLKNFLNLNKNFFNQNEVNINNYKNKNNNNLDESIYSISLYNSENEKNELSLDESENEYEEEIINVYNTHIKDYIFNYSSDNINVAYFDVISNFFSSENSDGTDKIIYEFLRKSKSEEIILAATFCLRSSFSKDYETQKINIINTLKNFFLKFNFNYFPLIPCEIYKGQRCINRSMMFVIYFLRKIQI